MKAFGFALIASTVLACPAFAGSVTVADNSTSLPGVAAALTSVLLDAGLDADEESDKTYVVEARRLHCDRYSNAPLDASDSQAGLPSVTCRVRSRNQKDTNAGRRFREGHAITELLQKIQDASGSSIQLTDCASGGYCGFFARSIQCTIKTSIDDFNGGGRWSCTLTDQ